MDLDLTPYIQFYPLTSYQSTNTPILPHSSTPTLHRDCRIVAREKRSSERYFSAASLPTEDSWKAQQIAKRAPARESGQSTEPKAPRITNPLPNYHYPSTTNTKSTKQQTIFSP